MPSPYAPLPNPRYAPEEVQRELNHAFELNSDDDDDGGQDSSERTPLTRFHLPRSDLHHRPLLDGAAFPEPLPTRQTGTSIPGGYDFECDYDYGSPPRPLRARARAPQRHRQIQRAPPDVPRAHRAAVATTVPLAADGRRAPAPALRPRASGGGTRV